MNKIFITFPTTGKIYSYETSSPLKPDEEVLAENEQVIELGKVVKETPEMETEPANGQIVRSLTEEDRVWLGDLKKAARQFIEEARSKVARHGLKMKILDADLSFDQKKLTFYFCADSRVDFRSLVSDMAKSFNKLIRLQQVGGREAIRFFGGIGKCGRELCCKAFLKNLESVTLEMAQSQELSAAGSGKITGCCGKLMCCLSYEAENYKELKKKMPKMNSHFSTPQGEGKVIGYNLLGRKVILENKEGKKIEVVV